MEATVHGTLGTGVLGGGNGQCRALWQECLVFSREATLAGRRVLGGGAWEIVIGRTIALGALEKCWLLLW